MISFNRQLVVDCPRSTVPNLDVLITSSQVPGDKIQGCMRTPTTTNSKLRPDNRGRREGSRDTVLVAIAGEMSIAEGSFVAGWENLGVILVTRPSLG
ncbi:hypothetical protein CC2G_013961 [Coprinopsis cinerea AmutBmut pab1-1]|nr:hypothetical protein CC2G_013961 [Coprinopsis cinerea AmutBmut pab1-1]